MRSKLPYIAFFYTIESKAGDYSRVREELAGKPPIATAEITSGT